MSAQGGITNTRSLQSLSRKVRLELFSHGGRGKYPLVFEKLAGLFRARAISPNQELGAAVDGGAGAVPALVDKGRRATRRRAARREVQQWRERGLLTIKDFCKDDLEEEDGKQVGRKAKPTE